MTIPASDSEYKTLLKPLGNPRSRTEELVERLAAQIVDGRLAAGSRLPTEQEMATSLGVSRTVVREAVAALKAEGMLVARHGVGVFVASDIRRRPFRIDPNGLGSIREVLEIMELRSGIEIEGAGLAAERGSASAIAAIGKALEEIEAAMARGDTAIDEDFAFHLAIAGAAGNEQFPRFLDFLGRHIIPRQSVRVTAIQPDQQRQYLATIQREHRDIFAAIQRHDPEAARHAMRTHIGHSLERYRRLAAEAEA